MRRLLRTTALTIALAVPALAQNPRASLLVTPQWLNQHLRDPNLVILHVGDKADYDKAHIPGARFIGQRDVSVPDTAARLVLQMPAEAELRERLARIGISDDSRIAVVFGQDWFSPATRVTLTLDYAGFGDRTVFLDGGTNAWKRAGFATTADVPTITPGNLSALKVKPIIVTADFVRDNVGKPGIAVVDGRAAVYYDGTSEGGPPGFQRKGHVKGALSVPFTEVTNDSTELKSAEQLQALFTKAGVKPGDTVIGYCHIGQQATAMLFAARILGYKVALFDGSFEEWARRGYPLEVPPGR